MAITRADRPIARLPPAGKVGEPTRADGARDGGSGPVIALVRSLLLLALAALAILGLLPAVVAAQAAAAL